MDKDSRCANRFIIFFYLFHIFIIASTLNRQEENYVRSLSFVLGASIMILFVGLLYQSVKWNNRQVVNVIILIVANTFICILMTFLSLIIVLYGLTEIYGNVEMTKSLFNIMVTSGFLITSIFYFIYQKPKVQDYIERLAKWVAKKGAPTIFKDMKNKNPNLENEFYEEEAVKDTAHKFIDLITILVTVFLLGNSTFATLNPSGISLTANPFDSLEFTVLIYVILIYVQSAFYRLTS